MLHIQTSTKKKAVEQEEVLIWSLKLVGDQLFSGDSKGTLAVWDCQHGTLIKSFSNLKADIQAIEYNHKYKIVYASGVDSRVMSVQWNPASS